MRLNRLVPTLCLACTLAIASIASATERSTQLDRSFGDHGARTITLSGKHLEGPAEPSASMAAAPGGVVSAVEVGEFPLRIRIDRTNAGGRPVRSFGSKGTKYLSAPQGSIELGGIAVDPRGRVLVAATLEADPRQVLLARLLPNGSFDTEFGDGGTVLTDFGARVPLPPGYPSPDASIQPRSTGVAIDSDGRIVLFGAAIASFRPGKYASPEITEAPLVARFLPDGNFDPSWAGVGYRVYPELPAPYYPLDAFALGRNGDVFVSACRVAEYTGEISGFGTLHLLADGNRDPAFGAAGFVATPDCVKSTDVDNAGRLLALSAYSFANEGPQSDWFPRLSRLLPDGSLDPSFGKGGVVGWKRHRRRLPLWEQVAVDPACRIVLLGHLGTVDFPLVKPSRALAGRLLAEGRRDPSFGHRGEIAVRTGRGTFGPTALALSGADSAYGAFITIGSPKVERVSIVKYRSHRRG